MSNLRDILTAARRAMAEALDRRRRHLDHNSALAEAALAGRPEQGARDRLDRRAAARLFPFQRRWPSPRSSGSRRGRGTHGCELKMRSNPPEAFDGQHPPLPTLRQAEGAAS
jgi:hypothetical protein